ncbi:hypothetical protein C8R48DRAFT_184468 [Suillus tomentosus]|nr:hypothetical protein C8R48DRAFT_184468 [Suillus tomentosus]
MTFSWVYPLITRGSLMTMSEDDVRKLSPTQQSRPVLIKFTTIIRSSLIRRLWAANSQDLLLDFCLTYVSVIFAYTSPFLLKRILDAIEESSAED